MNGGAEGGTVVLISGASRGLGRALAIGFAKQGARVAIFARDRARIDSLAALVGESGASVFAGAFDIRQEAASRAFVESVMAKFGQIDVLINNASILGRRSDIASYPAGTWRDVIDTNMNGAFYLTQAVLPGMRSRRSGSIINVSSSVGRSGRSFWGAYAASKFALEGFSQVLAAELRGEGIRVNTVNPGALATDMRREAYPDEDPSTLHAPEDILEVFYYLASDQSQTITGETFDAQLFHI